MLKLKYSYSIETLIIHGNKYKTNLIQPDICLKNYFQIIQNVNKELLFKVLEVIEGNQEAFILRLLI